MPWHARLDLDYHHDGARSIARFRHEGPLRVLQSLYPEGPDICHNVLVHPPSGLVGGDTLSIRVQAAAGSHGLITTPGATRFYRSEGEVALQHTRIRVDAGARLEWLPLEALCYSGCLAENRLELELAPGAEMIGWDVTALGLPHAHKPFGAGHFQQHIEWPGVWLERGRIAADDARLLDGPLGLAGHRCLASLFILSGTPLARARRERLLELARALLPEARGEASPLPAGVTSPQPQVIVLRALAPVVEPAFALLRRVWSAWRQQLWQRGGDSPRIWNT
ncbi:urease accessory protein UreD [Xenophilus sp. Marseille-Q4582]|uniref:urease accessory protein UreD n=1 Tax=Xenophilus sp. Marseille-Q4582 TaxID=2866600 RepID=UPI001CE45D1F|nr:urease accessory protein UreD [Xenophilus sp. Marseille-Q4582]